MAWLAGSHGQRNSCQSDDEEICEFPSPNTSSYRRQVKNDMNKFSNPKDGQKWTKVNDPSQINSITLFDNSIKTPQDFANQQRDLACSQCSNGQNPIKSQTIIPPPQNSFNPTHYSDELFSFFQSN